MKKIIIRVLLWALVLGWMGFIFVLSAQPGDRSHEMSSDVLEKIYDVSHNESEKADKVHTKNFIDYYQYTIRQIAHFTIFTVLGILVTAVTLYIFKNTWVRIVLPLFVSITYPLADELFQQCVPDRAFEWNDFGTDIVGALLGCVIVYLIFGVIIYKLNKK